MSSLLSALKKKKSPDALVKAASAAMAEGNAPSLAKRLLAMKEVLYGEEDKEPVEAKCKELAASLRVANLLPPLIEAMPELPFETRKDVAAVFNNLMRKNYEGFADYVASDQTMVKDLVSDMTTIAVRYDALCNPVLDVWCRTAEGTAAFIQTCCHTRCC